MKQSLANVTMDRKRTVIHDIEPKAKLNDIVSRLKRKKHQTAADEEKESNFLRILYGTSCVGIFLSFREWDDSGIERSNNSLQCLVPWHDMIEFLSENQSAVELISLVPNLRVLLKVTRMERVKSFVESFAEIDAASKLYKPVLLLAAEYNEWAIVGAIFERKLALSSINRSKFSRKILTYISQSCSTSLMNQFINSFLNIGLNFTEAILLAYESQRPDVIDFIFSLELQFDVRLYDCRLAIEVAISYFDIEFLKFLHERGVEGGRLIHDVEVDAVGNFLQACFDLANDPIAYEDAASLVFPYDPSTILISFIPACIEGLIRHSRSPLTCISALMKTPTLEIDDENMQINSSIQPSFACLFTSIMRHPLYDATILKRLLQLWVATKRAAERVEEEREDLLNFCQTIENVVTSVFACDATNRDENLLPLIRMHKVVADDILHQLEAHQHSARNSLRRNRKGLSSKHLLRTSDKFHAHDMRWIFGEDSFIKLALDKKFKVAFGVPHINRLILLIFDSARFEFQESYFQERFYPQILFYIDMSMRIITFILIGVVAIYDYPKVMNISYSTPRKFVSFSGTEVFFVLFLFAEIIHELGEFWELRQELIIRDQPQIGLIPNRDASISGGTNNSTSTADSEDEGEEKSGMEEEDATDIDPAERSDHVLDDISQSKPEEIPLTNNFPSTLKATEGSVPPVNSPKKSSKSSTDKQKKQREENKKRSRSNSRASTISTGYSADLDGSSPTSFASYISTRRQQPQRRRQRRMRRKREVIQAYMRDEWNFVDMVNCLGGLLWFILRCIPSQFIAARVTLSLLAIPWSIGLLRFFSINKTLGELVIIIRAMLQDLTAFVVVYIVMIAGFGVAFRGLFADTVEYATMTDTFLALFSGTLSNFAYDIYNTGNKGVNTIGIILTLIFVIMTAIMLINLLIAKMSTSFQRVSDKSQMEWAFERAKLVRSLTLIREKDVWNILPAPLNLVPILLTVGGLADWNVYQRRNFVTYQKQLLSIPGNIVHSDEAFIENSTVTSTTIPNDPRDSKHNDSENKGYFLVSIRGTIANITLFFMYFPLAKLLEICIAFAYTFVVIGRDESGAHPPGSLMNMSPKEFVIFLLQSIFYLIIYWPLFLIEMLRSLSRGEWISRPWVSYLFNEDQHLVSHTEKVLLLEAVNTRDQKNEETKNFSPSNMLSTTADESLSSEAAKKHPSKSLTKTTCKSPGSLPPASSSSFFTRSAYAIIKDKNYSLYPPGWDTHDLSGDEEKLIENELLESDEDEDDLHSESSHQKRRSRRRQLLNKYSQPVEPIGDDGTMALPPNTDPIDPQVDSRTNTDPIKRIFKDEDIENILQPFIPATTSSGLHTAAATAAMTMLLMEEQAQKIVTMEKVLTQSQQEQQQMKKMNKEMHLMLRTLLKYHTSNDSPTVSSFDTSKSLAQTLPATISRDSPQQIETIAPTFSTSKLAADQSLMPPLTVPVESGTARSHPLMSTLERFEVAMQEEREKEAKEAQDAAESEIGTDSSAAGMKKKESKFNMNISSVTTAISASKALLSPTEMMRPRSISFKRQRSLGAHPLVAPAASNNPLSVSPTLSAMSLTPVVASLPQRSRPPLPPPPKPLRKQVAPPADKKP